MRPEASHEAPNGRRSHGLLTACLDHEVGAAALFGIGHLERANPGELGRRHARPREHAAALHPCGRRDDDHPVDLPPAILLEQQRDVEHRHSAGRMTLQEIGAGATDRRVDQALEPVQRRLVVQHDSAERLTVDAERSGRARKQRLDLGDEPPAGCLQAMHFGIRIEDRHPQPS